MGGAKRERKQTMWRLRNEPQLEPLISDFSAMISTPQLFRYSGQAGLEGILECLHLHKRTQ